MFGTSVVHRVRPGAVGLKKGQTSRRKVVLAVAISVTVFSGVQSLALFTSAPSASESLRTGTLVLSLLPTSTTIALTGMAPGDSTAATFNLQNTGSLDLRYAVTASSTSGDTKNLAHGLTASLYHATCASKTSGDVVSSGPLDTLALGDPTTGKQTGDRSVLAGATESLCLTVDLTTGAGNEYQDASTATTITFQAEQIKNTAGGY